MMSDKDPNTYSVPTFEETNAAIWANVGVAFRILRSPTERDKKIAAEPPP